MTGTRTAFHHLLTLLDTDIEQAAKRYEELRSKLTRLFEWRRVPEPEVWADEALERMVHKPKSGAAVPTEKVAAYLNGIAHHVFQEVLRDRYQRQEALERLAHESPGFAVQTRATTREEALERMQACLEKLSPDERMLIVRYYEGDQQARIENRKVLAEELGISPGNLRIRCLRIRGRLEACLTAP